MADEATIQVTVDGEGGLNLQAVGPLLAEGIRAATEYVQEAWREAAVRGVGSLPPIKDPQEADWYSIGIQVGLQYPFGEDPLHGRVDNMAGEIATRIEHGYAAFDMKPGLLHGSQARRSKDGTIYNIVPFTWGTPRKSESEAGTGTQRATMRTMPVDVYNIVKGFTQSRRTGSWFEPSIHADKPQAMRQVYEYDWGDKLHAEDVPAAYAAVNRPWHKASLYAGMVRMATDEGAKKKRSQYMTFRVVSEKSDPRSWIHPGVKGKPYSQEVVRVEADNVRALVRRVISEGLKGGAS